jgi:leucyl-tRNA synthetase
VPAAAEELPLIHALIKKVTQDLERMSFNTAISAFMVFLNEETKRETKSRAVLEDFLRLLSPFAAHMAEELWEKLGHKPFVCQEAWPQHDEKYLVKSEIEIPIQVNGKIKFKIMVPAGITSDELESMALNEPRVKEALGGKAVQKVIVVPKRLVNVVAS